MLEAQQQQLGNLEFWDMKPALLSIDKAAALTRRYLDRLIDAEGQACEARPAAMSAE